MSINLKRLFFRIGETIDISNTFDFSDVDWLGHYPFTSPVKVTGQVTNNAGRVEINALIEFDYTAPCDRCARESVNPMNVTMEHILVQDPDEDFDDEVIVLKNFNLNFKELVLSDVLLSLPMVVLCKPDCAGICLNCGNNLNEESCSCKA